MDIQEAVARIFRAHKGLLIICLVLGIAAGLGVHTLDRPAYKASARVAMDAADPTAETEAAAIADSAMALVTSPNLLSRAVRLAGVTRDATQLADDVQVTPVGVSRIVEVSVKDRDSHVAAALVNALARELVQARIAAGQASIADALQKLRTRIAALQALIDQAHQQIVANPGSADVLTRKADDLVQQQLILEQEEAQLVAADAERPSPTIVDRAVPPASPESSHLVADVALGALLGLVLGLGLAGLLETVRPTVVGSHNLSRELDAPVLDELDGTPAETGVDVKTLADRVRLAARTAHVEEVRLVGAGADPVLGPLVNGIRHSLNGGPARRTQPWVEPLVVGRILSNAAGPVDSGSTGLIVVAPTLLPKEELNRVRDLLAITQWPLLGVVTYRDRRGVRDLLPWPTSQREVGSA